MILSASDRLIVEHALAMSIAVRGLDIRHAELDKATNELRLLQALAGPITAVQLIAHAEAQIAEQREGSE